MSVDHNLHNFAVLTKVHVRFECLQTQSSNQATAPRNQAANQERINESVTAHDASKPATSTHVFLRNTGRKAHHIHQVALHNPDIGQVSAIRDCSNIQKISPANLRANQTRTAPRHSANAPAMAARLSSFDFTRPAPLLPTECARAMVLSRQHFAVSKCSACRVKHTPLPVAHQTTNASKTTKMQREARHTSKRPPQHPTVTCARAASASQTPCTHARTHTRTLARTHTHTANIANARFGGTASTPLHNALATVGARHSRSSRGATRVNAAGFGTRIAFGCVAKPDLAVVVRRAAGRTLAVAGFSDLVEAPHAHLEPTRAWQEPQVVGFHVLRAHRAELALLIGRVHRGGGESSAVRGERDLMRCTTSFARPRTCRYNPQSRVAGLARPQAGGPSTTPTTRATCVRLTRVQLSSKGCRLQIAGRTLPSPLRATSMQWDCESHHLESAQTRNRVKSVSRGARGSTSNRCTAVSTTQSPSPTRPHQLAPSAPCAKRDWTYGTQWNHLRAPEGVGCVCPRSNCSTVKLSVSLRRRRSTQPQTRAAQEGRALFILHTYFIDRGTYLVHDLAC